jgi:hypothetical protein
MPDPYVDVLSNPRFKALYSDPVFRAFDWAGQQTVKDRLFRDIVSKDPKWAALDQAQQQQAYDRYVVQTPPAFQDDAMYGQLREDMKPNFMGWLGRFVDSVGIPFIKGSVIANYGIFGLGQLIQWGLQSVGAVPKDAPKWWDQVNGPDVEKLANWLATSKGMGAGPEIAKVGGTIWDFLTGGALVKGIMTGIGPVEEIGAAVTSRTAGLSAWKSAASLGMGKAASKAAGKSALRATKAAMLPDYGGVFNIAPKVEEWFGKALAGDVQSAVGIQLGRFAARNGFNRWIAGTVLPKTARAIGSGALFGTQQTLLDAAENKASFIKAAENFGLGFAGDAVMNTLMGSLYPFLKLTEKSLFRKGAIQVSSLKAVEEMTPDALRAFVRDSKLGIMPEEVKATLDLAVKDHLDSIVHYDQFTTGVLPKSNPENAARAWGYHTALDIVPAGPAEAKGMGEALIQAFEPEGAFRIREWPGLITKTKEGKIVSQASRVIAERATLSEVNRIVAERYAQMRRNFEKTIEKSSIEVGKLEGKLRGVPEDNTEYSILLEKIRSEKQKLIGAQVGIRALDLGPGPFLDPYVESFQRTSDTLDVGGKEEAIRPPSKRSTMTYAEAEAASLSDISNTIKFEVVMDAGTISGLERTVTGPWSKPFIEREVKPVFIKGDGPFRVVPSATGNYNAIAVYGKFANEDAFWKEALFNANKMKTENPSMVSTVEEIAQNILLQEGYDAVKMNDGSYLMLLPRSQVRHVSDMYNVKTGRYKRGVDNPRAGIIKKPKAGLNQAFLSELGKQLIIKQSLHLNIPNEQLATSEKASMELLSSIYGDVKSNVVQRAAELYLGPNVKVKVVLKEGLPSSGIRLLPSVETARGITERLKGFKGETRLKDMDFYVLEVPSLVRTAEAQRKFLEDLGQEMAQIKRRAYLAPTVNEILRAYARDIQGVKPAEMGEVSFKVQKDEFTPQLQENPDVITINRRVTHRKVIKKVRRAEQEIADWVGELEEKKSASKTPFNFRSSKYREIKQAMKDDPVLRWLKSERPETYERFKTGDVPPKLYAQMHEEWMKYGLGKGRVKSSQPSKWVYTVQVGNRKYLPEFFSPEEAESFALDRLNVRRKGSKPLAEKYILRKLKTGMYAIQGPDGKVFNSRYKTAQQAVDFIEGISGGSARLGGIKPELKGRIVWALPKVEAEVEKAFDIVSISRVEEPKNKSGFVYKVSKGDEPIAGEYKTLGEARKAASKAKANKNERVYRTWEEEIPRPVPKEQALEAPKPKIYRSWEEGPEAQVEGQPIGPQAMTVGDQMIEGTEFPMLETYNEYQRTRRLPPPGASWETRQEVLGIDVSKLEKFRSPEVGPVDKRALEIAAMEILGKGNVVTVVPRRGTTAGSISMIAKGQSAPGVVQWELRVPIRLSEEMVKVTEGSVKQAANASAFYRAIYNRLAETKWLLQEHKFAGETAFSAVEEAVQKEPGFYSISREAKKRSLFRPPVEGATLEQKIEWLEDAIKKNKDTKPLRKPGDIDMRSPGSPSGKVSKEKEYRLDWVDGRVNPIHGTIDEVIDQYLVAHTEYPIVRNELAQMNIRLTRLKSGELQVFYPENNTKIPDMTSTNLPDLLDRLNFRPSRISAKFAADEVMVGPRGVSFTIKGRYVLGSLPDAKRYLDKFYYPEEEAVKRIVSRTPLGQVVEFTGANYVVEIPGWGLRMDFPSIGEAYEYLHREVFNNWLEMDRIARERNFLLGFSNRKGFKYKLTNETGTFWAVDEADVGRILSREPDPSFAPNLFKGIDQEVLDQYSSKLMSKYRAEYWETPVDFKQKELGNTNVSHWITPMASWIETFGRKTGDHRLVELWQELDRTNAITMVQTNKMRQILLNELTEKVPGKILKGKMVTRLYPEEIRHGMSMWLEAVDDTERAAIVEKMGLEDRHIQSAKNIREIMGSDMTKGLFAKFGVNPNLFLFSYLPRIREAAIKLGFGPGDVVQLDDSQLGKALMYSGVPSKEIGFWAEHSRLSDMVNFSREHDLARLVLRYNEQGHKKFFLDPIWKRLDDYLKNKNLGSNLIDEMRTYRELIMGTYVSQPERQVKQWGVSKLKKLGVGADPATLSRLQRVSVGILSKLGIKDPSIGANIADLMFTMNTLTSQAWRPWLTVRNMTQIFTTTSVLTDMRYLNAALKHVSDNAASEVVRGIQMGVVKESPPLINEILKGDNGVIKAIGELTEGGMGMMMRSDALSRMVAYNSAERQFEGEWGAFHKLFGTMTDQNKTRMYEAMGVNLVRDGIRQQVMALLEKGDDVSFKAAKHLFADDMQKLSMFDYSKTNAAQITRGLIGKTFGQYQTYPMYYIALVKHIMTHGTKAQRIKMVTKLAAMATATYGAFELLGVEGKNMLPWSPAQMTGGPIFNLGINLLRATDTTSYRGRQARGELQGQLLNMTPGIYEIRMMTNFLDQMDKGNPWLAFLALSSAPLRSDLR